MDFAPPPLRSPVRRPKCQALSSVCYVSKAMTCFINSEPGLMASIFLLGTYLYNLKNQVYKNKIVSGVILSQRKSFSNNRK